MNKQIIDIEDLVNMLPVDKWFRVATQHIDADTNSITQRLRGIPEYKFMKKKEPGNTRKFLQFKITSKGKEIVLARIKKFGRASKTGAKKMKPIPQQTISKEDQLFKLVVWGKK